MKKKRHLKNVNPGTVLIVRQVIVGLFIATFFGGLITSVWYGTRVEALTINKVTVSGGETIPHSEVEGIVREKLDGAYLKLIPHAFAFAYPEKDIINSLKEIKRIKNLNVVRVGGTKLAVEFEEYVPHALWCKDSDSDGCYFLDDNGYSFSPAPSLTGGSFVRFVSVATDPSEQVQAFNPDEYKKVHELISLFSQSGWYVSKAELDGAGDAFFTIVEGGEFKISLKQSATDTVDNMKTVLNSEKFAHIKPGNFEYVDLRFGSKVFVNEVTIKSPEASSTNAVVTASAPEVVPNPAVPVEPSPAVLATEGASTTSDAALMKKRDQ